MRIKTPLLAFLTLAAVSMPLTAAQAQTKIGVVNVARLLQEAPQAQAASQALESEFAARKRDLQNMERDLKAREEKLQKDGATMAEADRRNQEKALRDGQREFARKQNEFLEDLNVRRNEALGQLQRSVLQEVQAYDRTILPSAQQAVDTATRGFEMGKFNFLDVLDAQRTLIAARTQYLAATAQATDAWLRIERIYGDLARF